MFGDTDMSKTALTDIEGWTPVFDDMARKHGAITAVVFGRIWRFCQGEKQVCVASLDRIAEDLGLDKATVLRHAKKLVEEEYLEDLTPNLRNLPHTYSDTGKAGMLKFRVETVAQCNAKPDPRCTPQRRVAESQLKIQLREDVLIDSSPDDAYASSPPQKRLVVNEPIPTTDGGKKLFGQLCVDAAAKGRRGPAAFESVAQRDKFLQAEQRLNGQLDQAITAALEMGITSRARIVAYIAKYASGYKPVNLHSNYGQPKKHREINLDGL